MTLLVVFILAILQGITEFFPVSSSGHLVLGQHWLAVSSPGIALEIALHLGTLLSVMVVFHKDIVMLLQAGFSIINLRQTQRSSKDTSRKLLWLLIISSVPTAVIAIIFDPLFDRLFNSPRMVGYALMFTATVLYFAKGREGSASTDQIGLKRGLMVGVAQGISIIPGVSRSGLTIATGLFCGLSRETATKFSFLLSLPAIAGAALVKLPELINCGLGYPLSWLLLGMVISAITGIVAIKTLLYLLRKNYLRYFAYYVGL
ncbi:MAG: undecaprenyl-diphosphate phosphatase, partial [bacterium]|nr:undecaprenyl-diphosphate phosphatase [bacterium]